MGELVSVKEPKVLIIEADMDHGRDLLSVLRFINHEPVWTQSCDNWQAALDKDESLLAVLIGSCKTERMLQKLLKEVHDFDEHLPIYLLAEKIKNQQLPLRLAPVFLGV